MALKVPYAMSTMPLKLNHSPAFFGIKNQFSRMCFASFESNRICQIKRQKVLRAMDMAAGDSDGPKEFKLEHIIGKVKEVWESAPDPVKTFPWNRSLDCFIQLIIDIVLSVVKYLYVPVLAVTSISEMSYCAHERKLHLILLPVLLGVAVAGVLKEAALESSPSLKKAQVPWHLLAIAIFFTLVKLPGPYYPYWGRILIPHFANGVLLRTLWFSILWFRGPKSSSETDFGTPEQFLSVWESKYSTRFCSTSGTAYLVVPQ